MRRIRMLHRLKLASDQPVLLIAFVGWLIKEIEVLDKISPEQTARFAEWSKQWIEVGLSTEPADFEAATEAALKAYRLCNLQKPMIVLRMSSPYGATFGGALAWAMLREVGKVGSQVESQVGSQVWSQVGAQVGAQVESQVGSQVGAQVRSQVGSQVRSQVESQVRSQVGSQVWSQVRSQVGSQVESQVGAQLRNAVDNYRGGQLWSAGFCAYVSFFRDVMGWRDPILESFEVDEALVKSCGWVWWHENVLAISDRPNILKRDDTGRLHCETGPSIAYRDGWALHHWHGTAIPAEWVTAKKPTAQEALQWENVEQRRAACEILGWAQVLNELDAKVIDKDEDEEIGTLLEVNLPDSGPERFLSVRCGTGRQFAIPVPREIESAFAGNAWTYGLDKLSFKPEVRT